MSSVGITLSSSEKFDSASLPEEKKSTTWEGGNIIIQCILLDDQECLNKALSDQQDVYHEEALSLLNCKNNEGKSPLELCCMLGRPEILKLLIKYGCNITHVSPSGYSPAHLCACWGRGTCLSILLENGFQVDCQTKYGETPRQLASRYKHAECVELIDAIDLEESVNEKKHQLEKKKSHHLPEKKKSQHQPEKKKSHHQTEKKKSHHQTEKKKSQHQPEKKKSHNRPKKKKK